MFEHVPVCGLGAGAVMDKSKYSLGPSYDDKFDGMSEIATLKAKVEALEGALFRIARLNDGDFCLAAHDIAMGALRNATTRGEKG